MKIIQIIDTLDIGGAERMLVNITNLLFKRGGRRKCFDDCHKRSIGRGSKSQYQNQFYKEKKKIFNSFNVSFILLCKKL